MIGSGKAKFVWDDKVYEGAFVNGKRTGKGKMTHSNGTIAQGDYVDGSLRARVK